MWPLWGNRGLQENKITGELLSYPRVPGEATKIETHPNSHYLRLFIKVKFSESSSKVCGSKMKFPQEKTRKELKISLHLAYIYNKSKSVICDV